MAFNSGTEGKALDPQTQYLIQTRQKLIESSGSSSFFYLGDTNNSFRNHVVWKDVELGSLLVTKESAVAVEKAQRDNATADTDDPQPSESAANTPDKPASLEPAILVAITFVDRGECWLTPCGHWKNNKIIKFENLKLSFQGKALPGHSLAQDSVATFENANWLMENIAQTGAKSKGFVLGSKTGEALRFRHVVFEELELSTGSDTGSETPSESDEDGWTMAKWPVIHHEAEIERDKLIQTHRPIPLPAYDLDGKLIHPKQCKKALAGAVVRVNFTLNHWYIDKSSREATNSFVASIQSIRILANPVPQTTSPKKRKTYLRDPDEESPSKKTRGAPEVQADLYKYFRST